MKAAGIFVGIALAFGIGFLVAQRSHVHPNIMASAKEVATNDDIALQEYESFVDYLDDTKQTNALKELNDFLNDERASQHDADLAVTVTVLEALREGKTNAILRFFENRLDTQIGLFGSEYSVLPTALQRQMNLKPLQQARDYRAKFPSTNPDFFSRQAVTNAFKLLDHK